MVTNKQLTRALDRYFEKNNQNRKEDLKQTETNVKDYNKHLIENKLEMVSSLEMRTNPEHEESPFVKNGTVFITNKEKSWKTRLNWLIEHKTFKFTKWVVIGLYVCIFCWNHLFPSCKIDIDLFKTIIDFIVFFN